MDRPLKFRVWDVEEKHWDHKPARLSCALIVDGKGNHFSVGPAAKRLRVMQFTGFLDKNGREIYEGDIVRYTDVRRAFGGSQEVRPVIGVNRNFAVLWENGAFTFDHFRTTFWNEIRNPKEIPDWDFPKCLEVIGNIYEDRDLLQDDGHAEVVNG